MSKAADVHHVGSRANIARVATEAKTTAAAQESDQEEFLAEGDYDMFDMEAATNSTPELKKAKKKKKEKKHSRLEETKREEEEVVVKESERRDESAGGEGGNQQISHQDHQRDAGLEDTQAGPARRAGDETGSSARPEDDHMEEVEEEMDSFDVDVTNSTSMSKKETAAVRHPPIVMDVRARANRRASQGGDLLGSQTAQSEMLRHQLRLLAGMSDGSESQQRKGVQSVELDIGSDDDFLPSVQSSRSNSIVGSIDGDSADLPPPPSPPPLPKSSQPKHRLVRQSSPIDRDLSEALDESYQIMSMDFRKANSSGQVDRDRDSSRSADDSPAPMIHETSNRFVRQGEVSRDDYDDYASSPLTSVSLDDQSRGTGAPDKGAAVIQSPSPDSGIHDFADTLCSSPVSELANTSEETPQVGQNQGTRKHKEDHAFLLSFGLVLNLPPASSDRLLSTC